MPPGRLVLVKLAAPAVSALVPRVVAPSLKVTVPIGVSDPGAVAATVAVKVTDWPNAEGLAEEATAVVVFAVFTVCVSAEEVLALKLPLPPYAAVMEWDPAVSAEVVSVATPELLIAIALPSVVDPSLKVTEPVGV